MIVVYIHYRSETKAWVISNEIKDFYNPQRKIFGHIFEAKRYHSLSEAIGDCVHHGMIVAHIDSITYQFIPDTFELTIYKNLAHERKITCLDQNQVLDILVKNYGIYKPEISIEVFSVDFFNTKTLYEGETYYSIDKKEKKAIESIVDYEAMKTQSIKFATEELCSAYIRKILS